MRCHVWTRLLLSSALLALACTGDRNQLPTQPVFKKAGTPTCDVARMTALINGVFPPGSKRGDAHARLAAIRSSMNRGKTAQAQSAMFAFIEAQLAALRAGELTDATNLGLTPTAAVAELMGGLYACSGLAEQAPPDLTLALEDGAVAVVTPTDPPTDVTTGDEQAGVSIATGAISQTQTVVVTITPDPLGTNPFPNPRGFQEFQPFYNFETFPPVAQFHEKVLVGICVELPEDAAQAHRLQLAHPSHTDLGQLEILDRVDAGFLPCNSFVRAGSGAGNLAQAGRAPLISRLANTAVALFRPRALHAATMVRPGGLGGQTGNFSDFRAIDPGETSTATSVDCGGDPGGDQLFRGFYAPGLTGTTLDRVTLHFSSNVAGLYTISLTARAGTYNGAILGTATSNVTLTANDQANVATTFTFPFTGFTPGSTVAFSLALVSGAGGVVFYSVPDQGDPTCAVVQTNGTSPPLDTFRRQGVHVKIETGLGNPVGT